MVSAARPLRVVYFGTPDFAVPTLRTLADSRHPVVAVVSQPDRPKGRGQKLAATPTKVLALSRGIPVMQPTKVRDADFLAEIARLEPDLGVVAAYGRILPEALLRAPRFGMINVHASLLPKYRGAAPIHRAVIAGEPETGVTIMRLVQEMDAGPMLATARRPIGPDETSVEVEHDLAESGARLLLDVVDRLAAGPVEETGQDHAQATYAPKITKGEGAVDWSLDAVRIHNLVRGLQPWPLVAVTLAGTRCLLHRTTVDTRTTESPSGTVVAAQGDDLVVAAGDGRLVRILSIQPEGRRAMSAREFLAGRLVQPGTRVSA